ncbi:MAG: sodium:proton antiporter [candidate division Zixibacteria bacterium]|nr:sodium:proton antiporter [candidate division Zixibacteria bacterium]
MVLRSIIAIFITIIFVSLFSSTAFCSDQPLGENDIHQDVGIGKLIPLWSIIPFVGILLSIAIFPLIAPIFWEHHFPKISFAWALIFAIPFLFFYRGDAVYEILHIYIIDYIPFIILLWGLFTVSGGILVRGTLAGNPKVNTIILIIGTILASWMGTTGASMLLIRPLIRANRDRKYKLHSIIFFIFLVSNIGGALTPLGDPPLFLGFLHGVPFFWTLNILPHMLVTSGILLILYFVIDTFLFIKEQPVTKKATKKEPLKIEGIHNIIFLAGIMGAVLLSGIWRPGEMNVFGIHVGIQNTIRDVLIITMGMFSLWTTKKVIRDDNEFSWFPIKEVAYLFAGIFMTIIPALSMLKAGSEGALAFIIDAVKEPTHYFWITGILSSFLDNAPTYLTFFNLAEGRLGITDAQVTSILTGITNGNAELFISFLKAISAGAVFFGAATYIGNAPNFMVRSITEESKIKMPSFFGYMLWSVGILVPIFVIVTFIFFS